MIVPAPSGRDYAADNEPATASSRRRLNSRVGRFHPQRKYKDQGERAEWTRECMENATVRPDFVGWSSITHEADAELDRCTRALQFKLPTDRAQRHEMIRQPGKPAVLREVRRTYAGELALAVDYMVFNVTKDDIKVRTAAVEETDLARSYRRPTRSTKVQKESYTTPTDNARPRVKE